MDLQIIPIYGQTPEQVRMQDGQGTMSQGDGNHINSFAGLGPVLTVMEGEDKRQQKEKEIANQWIR